jgi:hypothetical protein
MPTSRQPKKKSAAPRTPRRTLSRTDTPNVYRNRAGVLVDADGIALGFRDVKREDDARFSEVLGRTPTQPLDIIEGVAMDPRLPMMVRLDAAVKAAPYRHPKLVAVSGVAGGAPINVSLEGLNAHQLSEYESLLKRALNVVTAAAGQDKE